MEQSKTCPKSQKFLAEIRKMDADLSSSLQVDVPSDLVAKLQLNQLMQDEVESVNPFRRYAIAASLAVGLFVAGFMASTQFGPNSDIAGDYEALLAGVVDHMNEQPVTPVWESKRANNTANALLASYDGEMKLKFLKNLQFSRICPMGKYKGLHASLETGEGQVTFAYIKDDQPVSEIKDVIYDGYRSRIKPVRGGNLIIISRTNKGVEQADQQLTDAMYWEI